VAVATFVTGFVVARFIKSSSVSAVRDFDAREVPVRGGSLRDVPAPGLRRDHGV